MIDFLRSRYGSHFYGAHERYVRWLYLESPCDWFKSEAGQDRIPVNAIVDNNGAVQAIHAFVPFDARTPWGGTAGVWDIEWINASGVRGAGRSLVRTLLADVDIYAGYGSNASAEAAFASMGLTLVPEIPRRVAVLDPDVLRAVLDAIPGKRDAMVPLEGARTPRARWFVLDGSSDISDAVLEAYAEQTPFGVTRSRVWLRWRYDQHPFVAYAVVAADPTGEHGVAVVRLEMLPTRPASVCRLVEFFGRPGHEAALLGAVLAFARQRECFLCDYFSTDETAAARLDVAGAQLGAQVLVLPDLPYLFQPPAFAPRRSINLVIAAGGRAPTAVDLRPFHATKGDANQDILRTESTGPSFRGRQEAPGKDGCT